MKPGKDVSVGWSVQQPAIIGADAVGLVAVKIGDESAVMDARAAKVLALGIIEAAIKSEASAQGWGSQPVATMNGLPI
jgi:hypothetical protein